MGAQVRFVANHAGISSMLKSAPVAGVLRERGLAAKEAAESLSESGEARYRLVEYDDRDRAVCLVGTTDRVSRCSNAKHNSLLKGLMSC
jgi:hypothetical protein